jgi:hypothetical protein
MSDPLTLKSGERLVLRLFALDLPRAEAEGLRGNASALARVLGVAAVDPEGVEVLDLDDLSGLGLAAYLTEGVGLEPEQIAPMRAEIDALVGHVLIVHSSAAQGRAMVLAPAPSLRLIGVYDVPVPPVQFEPLPTRSAEGLIMPPAGPAKSDARIGGMVATAVLLFLAVFTVVFIWIAH